MTQPHLFCFGLGYSGLTLARNLLAEGWQVSGTCRTSKKAEKLTAEGIKTYSFGGERAIRDSQILSGSAFSYCQLVYLFNLNSTGQIK